MFQVKAPADQQFGRVGVNAQSPFLFHQKTGETGKHAANLPFCVQGLSAALLGQNEEGLISLHFSQFRLGTTSRGHEQIAGLRRVRHGQDAAPEFQSLHIQQQSRDLGMAVVQRTHGVRAEPLPYGLRQRVRRRRSGKKQNRHGVRLRRRGVRWGRFFFFLLEPVEKAHVVSSFFNLNGHALRS